VTGIAVGATAEHTPDVAGNSYGPFFQTSTNGLRCFTVTKHQGAIKFIVLATGTVNPNQVAAILRRGCFGTYLPNTT
jgi:hypothetical protein